MIPQKTLDWNPGDPEQAMSLPARYFYDEGIFRQEREKIFYPAWHAIAHESEFEEAGSYVVTDIFDQSVIVMRGPDGALRAFHNACQHRGNRLLHDRRGKTHAVIRCGYHSWCYNQDGTLRTAPRTERLKGFDKSKFGLKPVKLETMGLFDQLPAWNEATIGTLEERRAKLGDPARRSALRRDMDGSQRRTIAADMRRSDGEQGQVSMFKWDSTFIDDVHLDKNQHLRGKTVAQIAKEQGKHPVDALLDLAVEEDLKTEFSMQDFINNNEEAVGQILKHPLTLIGASDGGAHTKFLTLGRYPTHFLAHWVRDKQIMTLEEAHWRLSAMLGWAIGIRDRGWLREGMPADIVVYELEKLAVRPMETIKDLPDGDWRRVQKADGYNYLIVNGQVTFEDGKCTGVLPGKMLRSYDMAG